MVQQIEITLKPERRGFLSKARRNFTCTQRRALP